MKKKLTFMMGLTTSLAMVSCYPPQNPNVRPPAPTEPEEKKEDPAADVDPDNRDEYEQWRREQGLEDDPNPGNDRGVPNITDPNVPNPDNNRTTGGGSGPREINPDLPEREPEKQPVRDNKKNYPFAVPVPGKPGFVFNPYNQKKLDVRGVPSGNLVSDPRDPNQKFYVP